MTFVADPTQHPTPVTPAAEGRRRWPFTFTQVRLGVLMSALAFGVMGMVRDQRLPFDIGIGFAVLGVAMRIWGRYRKPKG